MSLSARHRSASARRRHRSSGTPNNGPVVPEVVPTLFRGFAHPDIRRLIRRAARLSMIAARAGTAAASAGLRAPVAPGERRAAIFRAALGTYHQSPSGCFRQARIARVALPPSQTSVWSPLSVTYARVAVEKLWKAKGRQGRIGEHRHRTSVPVKILPKRGFGYIGRVPHAAWDHPSAA